MSIGSRFARLVCLLICISIILSSSLFILSSNVRADGASNILRLGFTERIMSANPWVGIYEPDFLFYSLIYDTLVTVDEDMQLEPNLACSWHFMDGPTAATSGSDFSTLTHNKTANDWPLGSIWEFNLTETVFWNDGVPFTADDVVFTINIQIGPNFPAYWAYQPYTRWIDCIKKIDDHKVRIFFADYDTKHPVPISWASGILSPILPAHAFAGKPSTYVGQTWNGVPTIGTGPFQGTSYLEMEIIAQDHVTLVKNPYFNFIDPDDGIAKGLGHAYGRNLAIETLIMKFYFEEQALNLDLRQENIDCGEISPMNYLALNTDPTLPATLNLVSTLSADSYSKVSHFNSKRGGAPGGLNPCRLDPAVLRATALACNKSEIVTSVYKGLASPGIGIVSPVYPKWFWEPSDTEKSYFNVTNAMGTIVFSYNKTLKHVMDYDPALANRILDAAGYVWDNSSDPHVRKFGPIAADRLVAMGIIGAASTVLNWDDPYSSYVGPRPLKFEDVIERESFEDQSISMHIAGNWKDIGIIMTETLVNQATWLAEIYSYQYHFTESRWRGDWDPNYVLYVPTTYAISGWNEFGIENRTYDHFYDMQASSFNLTERRHYVNECLEWQYLSGSAMLFTCYPKLCFAYSEKNWQGWGDWVAHPRLAMNIPWCENPLWFNLTFGHPPTATFFVSPDSGITTTSFSVDASACTDDWTPSASLEVRWDWKNNGTWTAWTIVKTAHYIYSTTGQYTIKMQVKDTDGLINETTRNVIVSNPPPTTAATLDGTKGFNDWYVSEIDITLSVSAPPGVSIDWTRWRLDNGDWTDYTSKVHVSANGEHKFEYQSQDIAGNTDSIKTRTFKIDKTAPLTDATVANSQIVFHPLDNVSGVNQTLYRIDAGSWLNYTINNSIEITAPGNHTLEYYSIDKAGNIEPIKMKWINIGSTSTGTSGIPIEIFGLMIAIVIILAIALLYLMRKRTPAPPEKKQP